MIDRFSIRNNLHNFQNQNNCCTSTRTRLWQVFAKRHVLTYKSNSVHYDIVEDFLSYFGQQYVVDAGSFDHKTNINRLYTFIVKDSKWYQVYDFVELYIASSKERKDFTSIIMEINCILDSEKTGYHIINGLVTPITNEYEFSTIDKAIQICPQHVCESINKSLKLFSDRQDPDYNNAIKEIITAVESLCCTIVVDANIDGADTLGKAVNKLNQCGIILHEQLALAIKNLYKYTCNEDGKRHGGTTFIESDIEDARFMIVTCSAILNFLMVKWEKAKENKNE